MTLTLNRSQLAKELALLQSAAERKTTIPVLATVLTEFDGARCKFTVSDCSVTMQTEIEAQGEPWAGCIPLRQIAALSRLFEGEAVTIAPAPKNRVQVKCGESTHVLPAFEASAFPETDSIGEAVEVQVGGDALRLAIKQVLPCITTEDSRWAMGGVNFELSANLLRLVATNGHRLGVVEIPVVNETENKTLVDAQGLSALLKLDGNVTLHLSGSHMQFQCNQRVFTSRLLTGEFPQWQLIMPASWPHSIEFDAATMRTVLSRVAVTRAETFKIGKGLTLGTVRLDLHSDHLVVITPSNDKGESEERVRAVSDLNGESVAIGINPDYLSDFLSQIDGTATCQFKDDSTWPLFIHGNFRYVIATVRL